MSDLNFRGQRENEDVLLVVKENVWVFAKTGLIILILANILVLMFIMLGGAQGVFAYALLLFVLVAGIMVGYKWYIWANGNYILTNQRIIRIEQEGLFHRIITELELDKIQDISTEIKGPIQMFLNFGMIHIKTASSDAGLEIQNVTDPYEIQQQIVKAQNIMKNDFGGKLEIVDSFDSRGGKRQRM